MEGREAEAIHERLVCGPTQSRVGKKIPFVAQFASHTSSLRLDFSQDTGPAPLLIAIAGICEVLASEHVQNASASPLQECLLLSKTSAGD